jgi:ABC-type Fe3+ transport system substrate-binding protein
MSKHGDDGKMSRRSALRLMGRGAGATLLAAYGQNALDALAATPAPASGNAVDNAIAWARTNLPNSTPDIIRAAVKEGKLNLTLQQLGSDDAFKAMIRKFSEHYPFIDVSYTTQTSVQLTNKFNAELSARKGISDYLQLPSSLKVPGSYDKQGAILHFTISQDSAYPAKAKQSGVWYAWLRQYGATVYRRGALSDAEKKLVRTYEGLGDPRFKGRIGSNSTVNSTTVTAAYVLLNDSDAKIWRGLVANRPKVKPSSPALLDGLLAGEYDIALFMGFSTAASGVQSGAPVEFGVSSPAAVTYIPGVIPALAPNPNAAKLWQDWAMSREGQEIWSVQSSTISARTDITTKVGVQTQPWFFEDRASNKDIDSDGFVAKETEVIDRFKKDIQGG